MIAILQTRILHWKKQWFSILFWLLLPMVSTLAIIYIANAVQEDSKIPVGIVMEDDSILASQLVVSLKETPFIRVIELSETEAKNQVENHQLDSAFIIRDGYADKIEKGSRNRLLTSYKSDLSFAYTPVSEMIISYIQQDTGRSKAAHTVINLNKHFQGNEEGSWDEIVATSKEIQSNENLLRTTFSFANTEETNDEQEISLWNIWGLWAIFSILATFLLFDWIIKERHSSIVPRFAFIRFTFKNYLLQNIFWYTVLLFIVDILTAFVFHLLLSETVSFNLIGAIFAYRMTINLAACLLTFIVRHLSVFYSISFIITCVIAIISGAIIPVEGITNNKDWLEIINPIAPFLEREWFNPWLIVFIIVFSIWFFRKENSSA